MILAVSGGKGGVGKTTVSMNLGVELDSVVVDGDLTTADLPSGDGPDLHDVLADRADAMDAVEQYGSLNLLSCGRTLEGARAADLSKLQPLVTQLEREYGNVVVDCPAGLARDVGAFFEVADAVVLVTTPDEIALMDAVRTRELAVDFDAPIAGVALNKVTVTDEEREELIEDIEERLSATTVAIPHRQSIAESQDDALPVAEVAPDSPAADSFAELGWVLERIRLCNDRPSVNA